MRVQPGRVLGKAYRVERALGAGGVGAVFEAALQAYLDRARQLARSELPPLPVHGGGVLRPGVDLDDMSALRALLDEGLPLEQLR